MYPETFCQAGSLTHVCFILLTPCHARYYVKHNQQPGLGPAGLKAFKTLIYDTIKKDVSVAIITMINAERDGGDIDRALLKECVDLFENMGMVR